MININTITQVKIGNNTYDIDSAPVNENAIVEGKQVNYLIKYLS